MARLKQHSKTQCHGISYMYSILNAKDGDFTIHNGKYRCSIMDHNLWLRVDIIGVGIHVVLSEHTQIQLNGWSED